MSGWIYVVELHPSGNVKVGRTAKLGSRMTAHIAKAAFGGASIVRTFSVACADSVAAEWSLLRALRERQGVYVAHGQETFGGISFMDVARIANEVASGKGSVGTLDDIITAMQGEARVRTQVVLLRLISQHPGYDGWDLKSLTNFLRGQGVQTRKLSGGNMYVVLDDLQSMSRQNRSVA